MGQWNPFDGSLGDERVGSVFERFQKLGVDGGRHWLDTLHEEAR